LRDRPLEKVEATTLGWQTLHIGTHGEHQGKRELADIEEILNCKNITGPSFKIAQK